MELFVIDPKTHLVDINKPWISTIKEFKKILQRDKGNEGDADGRRKLQATKEFTFIYHYCDYRSKFTNYSESDLLFECLRNADLPKDTDVKKDEDLVAAIIRYRKNQNAPSLELLKELKEGLHLSTKVVRKVRLSIEKLLIELDLDHIEIEVDGKGKEKVVDPVVKLGNRVNALLEIEGKVATAITRINEQEDKVRKELGDIEGMRGDAKKGIREDKGSTNTVHGGAAFDDI